MAATMVLGTIFASCHKKNVPNEVGTGCISRVFTHYKSPLSAEDSQSAATLMKRNKIYEYVPDSMWVTVKTTSYTDTSVKIYARPLQARLPLFDEHVLLYFTNGQCDSMTKFRSTFDMRYVYPNIPHSELLDVRRKYLQRVNILSYKDTCLNAELGLYNVNDGATYKTTMTWRVTPADRDYPLAYITDEDEGVVVSYKETP